MQARNLKIVFAGSVGAGKTTAIRSVSEIEVVQTEQKTTDAANRIKQNTTVAMDYGKMVLEDKTVLHLYGTPGQVRFDFMWEILAQGALGVIILIDAASSNPFAQIDTYMNGFKKQLLERNVVIGISRTDLNKRFQLDEYRRYLSRYHPSIPLFTLDAREKQQVRVLVKALL